MQIKEVDEDYLVLDFENKIIKGRTTKKNFSRQIQSLKEIIK